MCWRSFDKSSHKISITPFLKICRIRPPQLRTSLRHVGQHSLHCHSGRRRNIANKALPAGSKTSVSPHAPGSCTTRSVCLFLLLSETQKIESWADNIEEKEAPIKIAVEPPKETTQDETRIGRATKITLATEDSDSDEAGRVRWDVLERRFNSKLTSRFTSRFEHLQRQQGCCRVCLGHCTATLRDYARGNNHNLYQMILPTKDDAPTPMAIPPK